MSDTARRLSVYVRRFGDSSPDLEMALAAMPVTADDGLGEMMIDVIGRVGAVFIVLGDNCASELKDAGMVVALAQSVQHPVFILATNEARRLLVPPHLRLMTVGAAVPDPAGRWIVRLRQAVERVAAR
jgi:hypothetical protein